MQLNGFNLSTLSLAQFIFEIAFLFVFAWRLRLAVLSPESVPAGPCGAGDSTSGTCKRKASP